ncbi:MAG: dTDP-4-dehydrorhamnose reductase [Desulfobacterales bacterium]|jgi:dTDP-4-dehydrorhamnose reductase
MKVLITGANGQLGRELARQSQTFDFEVHAFDHQQLDISDENRIQQALSPLGPSVVINAAAYTQVDRAEDEPDLAYAVNTDGASYLAHYCAANHLALIHISTDYVFDGSKNQPYEENDPIAPRGIYGQSKARGEAAIRSVLPNHIIVRTSWLYGVYGHNFVKTILRLASEKKTLKVVADQFGSPTSAADLAETILIITRQIANPNKHLWGTYHYCGAGITSWHGLAEKIIELAAPYTKLRTCQVQAISTDDWPTAAPRPPYSVLNCTRLKSQFGIDPQPWQQSLGHTIERIFSKSR